MQFKKKLAYMALGGLLVFMGQLLPSIKGGPQDVEFNEITCKKLRIVDDEGWGKVLLWTNKHGGFVKAFGKYGESMLSNDKYGGLVGAIGKDGPKVLD